MEQTFLNYLFGASLAALGWFARTLWDATQKLKDDLKDVEVDMATHYVRKVELENRLDKIEITLERIWDTVAKKVDKHHD